MPRSAELRDRRASAWLEWYLDEVAATKVRPSTLHRYRQEVPLYIGPSLGKVRLDKLTPDRISDFYQVQLQHLSAGSVRRLHALLRRSLSVALRWQLITWNPVTAVDPPSLTPTEVRPYSAEEAGMFLAAVNSTHNEARWLLAIALGVQRLRALSSASNRKSPGEQQGPTRNHVVQQKCAPNQAAGRPVRATRHDTTPASRTRRLAPAGQRTTSPELRTSTGWSGARTRAKSADETMRPTKRGFGNDADLP